METERRLSKSRLIDELPLACSDELAAVEFFERRRWGKTPACVRCGSVDVHKMVDSKTGKRNKRYLWRCHDCKEQYTVRIGAIYEESRLPMRHWAYAFWRMSTSKKGVAALEIQRHCQISYKSALFLLHRIRFALAPDLSVTPKLRGTVECDETYIGGKPRFGAKGHTGRGTKKTPVFAAVQRGGQIRRRVVTNVSGKTLKAAMREVIHPSARIITDEWPGYIGTGARFVGGHQTVNHARKEYARGDVYTNTAESSFALVKRGLIGIYHNVSRKHLHRYISQFDFVWNTRELNDGERTALAIRAAEGKRLTAQQSREA